MTKLSNEKREFAPSADLRVVVVERGPYLLYGSTTITQQFIMPDRLGESWFYCQGDEFSIGGDATHATPLCRCGSSHNKPLCDGSHDVVEWDDELTAPMDNILDGAQYVEGDDFLLSDTERYCSYARFCHPAGSVWRLTAESKEFHDTERRELAIREASMCPSARLMAWERGSASPYEFDFEPSVALLEDPEAECSGGVWLRGGVVVERIDGGQYELRNRVVLCRCGHSHNKPYCDGSHAAHHWSDGLRVSPRGESLPESELEVVAH